MKFSTSLLISILFISSISCVESQSSKQEQERAEIQKRLQSTQFDLNKVDMIDKLEGFWLAQSIGNWTGLVTEMDKIGNIGDIKTGDFYTRDDWGKPDQPSIWGQGVPSDLSPTINFVFENKDGVWGSDDDTDIEYMYQQTMFDLKKPVLSPEDIRNAWLKHIKKEEENYLWVSNQKAFDLMHEGMLPPETSKPENNQHYDMIDAQLTTEIFGLFAPMNPEVALKIAYLPIRTTASKEAADIAEFYVKMYAFSAGWNKEFDRSIYLEEAAKMAIQDVPSKTYTKAMFDYIYQKYEDGLTWEQTRDSVYQRYQVDQADGYTITSRNLYCNGCFAAGINYAASLISLFWGKGDLKETIKMGSLMGWDSDNPTATWSGMLGFMMGRKEVERVFNREFSSKFFIHRTRINFENDGYDDFNKMAKKGLEITKRVFKEFGLSSN